MEATKRSTNHAGESDYLVSVLFSARWCSSWRSRRRKR